MENKTIIIGKDKIQEGIFTTEIIGPDIHLLFRTLKEATDYYCMHLCNPIYNKIHYDCENCPIKNQ